MMDQFPDQHHVEHIRQRLWCGREYGQASVLVGAGFSRNARPRSAHTPEFSTWTELAGRMFDVLYPGPSNGNADEHRISRLKAVSGGGALKIAQEFELTMGRKQLDDLINQCIPNSDYQPGHLHELLLSLPWSDVFTTNYDTLLERTRPLLYDKKFDLILTASDIPGAMKPRIVKLHGSFPSHRPFIVTEEDYRTYPAKFAPFVNMVQQAIMENTLCLLGFSGDDPNFIYWSGWVRDNLGASAPPIYLVGLFDISPSHRRVLEQRNVVTIDLSPMFPKNIWADSAVRHQKAVEWFLLNLMNGTPPTVYHWPKQHTGRVWAASDGLPLIPSGPPPLPGPGPHSPERPDVTAEELLSLSRTWQTARQQYPGWLVLPKANRETLWEHTVAWLSPVIDNIQKLALDDQLALLYELSWRMDRCRGPILRSLTLVISGLLDAVNPFPRLLPVQQGQLTPATSPPGKHLNWTHLAQCWIELAFVLVREARDRQDDEMFEAWHSRLSPLVKERTDWESQWYYEQCLYWLYQGDSEKLRAFVQKWPSRKDIPLWEVRRASVLAELGELREAEEATEQAIVEIRGRLRPGSVDYGLLSQEGWAMLLLQTIRGNRFYDEQIRGEYRDRWEKLSGYRCNPWDDMEQSENALQKAPVAAQSVIQAYHAYALLRTYEQGAIPIRSGSVLIKGDAVVSAARKITSFNPLWALGAILRVGRDKETNAWFSETRLALMSQEEVDDLCQRFCYQLHQAIKEVSTYGRNSFWTPTLPQRQLMGVSVLLSRLCFRLTTLQKQMVLDLACEVYRLFQVRQYHMYHSSVQALFKGLIPQLLPEELLPRLHQLLELPVPSDNGFEVNEPQLWPEPIRFIHWHESLKKVDSYLVDRWVGPAESLIRIVEHGDDEARKRATSRLHVLHSIGGLRAEQKVAFGVALWKRLDPSTGFPISTDLYKFAFMALPHPEHIDVMLSFKSVMLRGDFHRSVERKRDQAGNDQVTFSLGANDTVLEHELLGSSDLMTNDQPLVEWSPQEAELLLSKAERWWIEEGEPLREGAFLDFFGQGTQRCELLASVLGRVIIPRLGSSEQLLQRVEALLDRLNGRGVCTLAVEPTMLLIDENRAERVSLNLRLGLNGLSETVVERAIEGVYNWLVMSHTKKVSGPPQDLIAECVNIVAARRQPGLERAIVFVSHVLERFPDYLQSCTEEIYASLQYLQAATELPTLRDLDSTEQLNTPIPVDQRIKYRVLSAHLAFLVYWTFEASRSQVSPIVSRWRTIALESPITSVRRAWSGLDI